MNILSDPKAQYARYTIEHRGNCILIHGEVPMTAFGALMMLVPKSSVMDTDVAHIYGVNFVVGPAEELKVLRDAGAKRQEVRERQKNPELSADCHHWLAAGERGTSSNYIFTRLTGVDAMRGWSTERDCHPFDPADFRRCQLLLETVPELQAEFHRMAGASAEWDALFQAWPNIIAALDVEAPGWRDGKTGRRAPTAYQLIRRAIGR